MASYVCGIRTNYFHVKNKEAFLEFAEKISCNDDDLEVWSKTDKNGNTVYGFGCCSSIIGISSNPDDVDDAYDKFIDELQKHIREDDAVIIFESGRQKLQYLNGIAAIITSNDYKFLDIKELAHKQTKRMLKNSKWDLDYEHN